MKENAIIYLFLGSSENINLADVPPLVKNRVNELKLTFITTKTKLSFWAWITLISWTLTCIPTHNILGAWIPLSADVSKLLRKI